jgi:phenylacetate-CoA ligase
MFRTLRGEFINNIEVTHVLRNFALIQFKLHQTATGDLKFSAVASQPELQGARLALAQLFGDEQVIEVARTPSFEGKIVQYTSEITRT